MDHVYKADDPGCDHLLSVIVTHVLNKAWSFCSPTAEKEREQLVGAELLHMLWRVIISFLLNWRRGKHTVQSSYDEQTS